jgi:L-alanine-DL-glutamate epimerase-like enolase superfamily enzyme
LKITSVRTISLEEYPNLTWVEIETDEGLVGLGETFFGAAAVHAYVHETAAPYLLGKDPLQIERHAKELYGYYLRFGGLGAEQRAGSAIDNALWDLLGQASGLPLHVLLGGRTRESIRAYNTCAGYGYARQPIQGVLDNTQWSNIGAGTGPYEDLEAFQQRAGELAKDLLSEGFTAMKIWPFDEYAVATDGAMLLPGDLDRGLEPLRQIRDAVGMDIDVAIELHSRWSLPAAKRIARACEEFEPMWFEDPLRIDNIDALAEFARSTRIPTIASELVSGKSTYKDILETGAFGYVMFDFGWVGGITEARKIAGMADAYHLPVAPHDCTGPVNFAVGVHFGVATPNAVFQEVVRAYYSDWFALLVTDLPRLENGYLYPLEAPGLGLKLKPGLTERPDAIVRVSS